MDKRKEELEQKRRKLAELRKAREERKTQLEKEVATTSGGISEASPAATGSKQEIDQLVNSLLGTNTQTSPSTPSKTEEQGMKEERRKEVSLAMTETVIFDLAPRNVIIYDKEVQTAEYENKENTLNEVKELLPPKIVDEEELRTRILKEELEKVKRLEAEKQKKKATEEKILEVLSEEESNKIMKNAEFVAFFDKSSKLVEKALNENPVLLRDYTIDSTVKGETSGAQMSILHDFYHEQYSKNSIVSAFQWSPKFPELALAAYKSQNISNSHLLIWNILLNSRPEFIFESQSSITSATFSEDHPNFIFAACQSGQILLFDTRVNKRTASLKSPLNLGGHNHPVPTISIVGTHNLNQLVSCSNDGKFCAWQLDMLAKPLETLDLTRQHQGRSEPISVSDFKFLPNDNSTFMLGSEDGLLNIANRYDKAGSKAGVNSLEHYEGHSAPITSMHFNSHNYQSDSPKLLISSSFDWTLKLWKVSNKRSLSTTTTISPVISFETCSNYVSDVKWAPKHSSIFASSDASGNLSLWDMVHNLEMPVNTLLIPMGISKIDWSPDGKRIGVGLTDGHVQIVNVPQTGQPQSNEEASHMKRVINGL